MDEQAAEVAGLRAEVDRLETAQALFAKREGIQRLLREFDLPDPDLAEGWQRTVVSQRFVESLMAAPDEKAMRQMVEERANLIRGANVKGNVTSRVGSRPCSRDQHQVYGASSTDVKAFVESIT